MRGALTTILTTTLTTAPPTNTPTTNLRGPYSPRSSVPPRPGSVGVRGSSPLSSTIFRQVSGLQRCYVGRRLNPQRLAAEHVGDKVASSSWRLCAPHMSTSPWAMPPPCAAQGVTADTTHAVLGENTTRSMLQGRRQRATKPAVIYRAVRNRDRQFWSSRSKTEGTRRWATGIKDSTSDRARRCRQCESVTRDTCLLCTEESIMG